MSSLIIVGDRVLIEPRAGEQQTESGLVLPASVAEKEKVQYGKVIRTGPGYLMPNPEYSEQEVWTEPKEAVRYLPLQAQPGDEVLFLRKEAIEIEYEKQSYLIVHHGAILVIIRPDSQDILKEIEGLMDEQ